MFTRLTTVCILSALVTTPIAAETLKVPADFETIQAAVDAALPDDVVQVGKGTYDENVSVPEDKGGLTLQGKGAIINGGYNGPCLEVLSPGVTVTGFVLVNGTQGVSVMGDGATVTKNRVAACGGGPLKADGIFLPFNDGAINVLGDNAVISQNSIQACQLAGIFYLADTAESDTLIEKNTVLQCFDGIFAAGGILALDRNRAEQNLGNGITVRNSEIEMDGFPIAAPPGPVSLDRNQCNGNQNTGIFLDNGDQEDVPMTADKNTTNTNGIYGLIALGSGFELTNNRADENGLAGFVTDMSDSLLQKNKAQKNGGPGFALIGGQVFPPADGFGSADDNEVIGNTAKQNGNDGIYITGNGHRIEGNVCDKNLGDGIDLDGLFFFEDGPPPTFTGNEIVGNKCRKNGHEGIDNSGAGTLIADNVCIGNASLDIAGRGNQSVGFAGKGSGGNNFKTPAEDDLGVAQVLDLAPLID